MRFRIGPASRLESTPSPVEFDGDPYILTKTPNGDPQLLDAVCPHQGGTIEPGSEECLTCHQHGWKFDPETGDSLNIPGESVTSYPVYESDGNLYADLPDRTPSFGGFSVDITDELPNITLVSHAALLVEYGDFSLLMDPWIDGHAFLGGWTQYPPPTHDVETLANDIDALWITHEHSDHLHPPTLEKFDADIPVYVPELNYQRLASRLEDVGLTNVHSLPTGSAYELADNLEAVCFESESTWNDSILLLNCGGFRILNVNDAGVNWNVYNEVNSVDLIASGFSFGASDYPIMWDHLSEAETEQMIHNRNEGQLDKCEQLVEMFDPNYFLPFAKFFELVPPSHADYRAQIQRNRPRDVITRLGDYSVNVLDLIPGEKWTGRTEEISRRPERESFFTTKTTERIVEAAYESRSRFIDEEFVITHEELAAYFESLQGSTLASKIGNHALSIGLSGDGRQLTALISFSDGQISYKPTDSLVSHSEVDSQTHVIMECPGRLVQYVIRNDLSWDEIRIGYWATFSRSPDEYNLAFWRLLHAPWEARADVYNVTEGYDIETGLSGESVADLIERQDVQDILDEYGLFCSGCPNAIGEDILEAARIHGLSQQQVESLVANVEQAIDSSR
ncbi:Rieske 2Fe-2S domain-containing protein [Halorubrum salsamenti]|uniref:Rieske 2Fe-2S domain-containing protein n=1 Tax=Halorubrum salsamenti TaxID=2583990 RepID=UPI001642C0C9|nr:Rieske 2Fe-2S domain-containing protein [Halorubrum salsamenti]